MGEWGSGYLDDYGEGYIVVEVVVYGVFGQWASCLVWMVEVVAVSSWFCVGGRENGNCSSGTNDGIVGGCAVGCMLGEFASGL